MAQPVEAGAPARLAIDIVLERLDVAVALEADQVIGEQHMHQRAVDRQGGQDFGGGKRDMQEKTDPVAAAPPAQRVGQREQVIVVDPDHVVGRQRLAQAIGQDLVDPAVGGPGLAVEFGQLDPIVEQRPEHAVGKSIVIPVIIRWIEIDQQAHQPPFRPLPAT